MEKYAVEIDKSENTKTASGVWYCRNCGRRVDPEANVPKCPFCGTEPFEKRIKD